MRSPGQIAYVGRIGMWSACACGYVTVQGRMRHDRAQDIRCGVTSGGSQGAQAVGGCCRQCWQTFSVPTVRRRGRTSHRGERTESRPWGPAPRAYRSGWSRRDRPAEARRSAAAPAGRARLFTVTGRADLSGTVGARMHHHAVTDDEPAPTTVRDRLTAAGLSDERIEQHMTAGRVRVDGELVTDPHRQRHRPRASLSRPRRASRRSPT